MPTSWVMVRVTLELWRRRYDEFARSSVKMALRTIPIRSRWSRFGRTRLTRGSRVTLRAELDKARCMVQLDMGYGDAVTPGPVEITYPGLLDDLPTPNLRAYPRETVFAEKLEAIAQLGIANSRMKDYFDLWALAREGAMDIHELGEAIAATFTRRGTPLPAPMPTGLTAAFSENTQKQQQWNAFVARNRLDAPALDAVVEALAAFVQEPMTHARRTTPGRENA